MYQHDFLPLPPSSSLPLPPPPSLLLSVPVWKTSCRWLKTVYILWYNSWGMRTSWQSLHLIMKYVINNVISLVLCYIYIHYELQRDSLNVFWWKLIIYFMDFVDFEMFWYFYSFVCVRLSTESVSIVTYLQLVNIIIIIIINSRLINYCQ